MYNRKTEVTTKYRHSDKCKWDGTSTMRYTYKTGLCLACDHLKSQTADGLYKRSESEFGMDMKTSKKIYCYNTRSTAERCTKYTNPKCACGKVVFFNEERPSTGQKEYFACVTYTNQRW